MCEHTNRQNPEEGESLIYMVGNIFLCFLLSL